MGEKYIYIAIIDYGVGNLFNVERALKYIGISNIKITSKKEDINAADFLILPGVGSFGEGMDGLRQRGLIETIIANCKIGKPILGICLGMQLLLDQGEEFGLHDGLGLIEGNVIHFSQLGFNSNKYKLPHIGWTSIERANNNNKKWLLNNEDNYYFVHSYVVRISNKTDILTYSNYGDCQFISSINKGNIYGCQFHPEKSGMVGLNFLKIILTESLF